MDLSETRGSDSEVDLESGDNTSDEEGGKRQNLIGANSKEGFQRVWSEEVRDFSETKIDLEKLKKPKSKWPPKPPRPPGGPSLDPADMKLVKEISELAILKRKRTERRKALDKLRKEKTSSKTSNLIAMAVTVLFFFVIIFQGLLGSRM